MTSVIGSVVDPSTHAIPAYTNSFHQCNCILHTELMSRFARQSTDTNDPVSPHTVALQHLKKARLQNETQMNMKFPLWLDRKIQEPPHQAMTSEQRQLCLLGCTVIHSQISDVCS